LVTSSGPSPVLGFIAAMGNPSVACVESHRACTVHAGRSLSVRTVL
jgi:hypothetical protein